MQVQHLASLPLQKVKVKIQFEIYWPYQQLIPSTVKTFKMFLHYKEQVFILLQSQIALHLQNLKSLLLQKLYIIFCLKCHKLATGFYRVVLKFPFPCCHRAGIHLKLNPIDHNLHVHLAFVVCLLASRKVGFLRMLEDTRSYKSLDLVPMGLFIR